MRIEPLSENAAAGIAAARRATAAPTGATVAVPRVVEFATAIMVRGAATEPWSGLLGPFGENHATTTVLNNWCAQEFGKKDPLHCLTHDPEEARLTGRTLIAARAPHRLVLNFEAADPFDPTPFLDMEKFRARIAHAFPLVTLSAYLGQAYQLVGATSTNSVTLKAVDMIRTHTRPYDEISPGIYYNPGDDPVGRLSKQHRMMAAWTHSLAPGKPLSPFVWWYVDHTTTLVDVNQFWGVQVAAAMSSLATRAVVLWGDLPGVAEQKVFEEWAGRVLHKRDRSGWHTGV